MRSPRFIASFCLSFPRGSHLQSLLQGKAGAPSTAHGGQNAGGRVPRADLTPLPPWFVNPCSQHTLVCFRADSTRAHA